MLKARRGRNQISKMSAIWISPPLMRSREDLSSSGNPYHPSILSNRLSLSSLSSSRRRRTSVMVSKCSDGGKDEWLPEKNKPIYGHSLPCLEAWLKSLGFYQSKDDRAVWFVQKPDWHAHLSLDVTDLHIRYLRTGPGNLEKDVERRFSYALSRDDIENAILGGP